MAIRSFIIWDWCVASSCALVPSWAPSGRACKRWGGNITLLTNLCEKTREHAFELMLQHAAELGANAVIGVRYDATELMQGVTEVLAYGTAVVVEKER